MKESDAWRDRLTRFVARCNSLTDVKDFKETKLNLTLLTPEMTDNAICEAFKDINASFIPTTSEDFADIQQLLNDNRRA